MFRLHKEMSRLDIPAQRVLRLERSLSDVQVAMPGLPAQEATAYLCSFSSGQGLRVAVALQLHSSSQLAFYLNDDGEVPPREGTRIYNQALGFAESMGFMLGDLDIHLKSAEERTQLWKSLPLQSGLAAPAPAVAPAPKSSVAAGAAAQAAPTTAPTTKTVVRAQVSAASGANLSPPAAPAAKLSGPPDRLPGKPAPPSPPVSASNPAGPSCTTRESVAPLVAAGGKSPTRCPTPAELAVKRKELRENLGRFLASL
ncbi:hypothetical protein JCM30471_04620 [Desulfuromonas carbonis]|uniref:hypothetical protein n=1 Tax=Desulfuromonas sp. DDH964 TaxID=1823759 RepID=UPI00078BB37E|nr:hypothetical protein [Desulfuromonas sp. DDH964]AMV71964.1 hypothetical protein DBW_1602 [Desulfuromonas sp. DDH964]